MDIPPELLLLILEHVYYNALGFPDRPTLCACALVCTSWTPIAQKMLFHSIRVPVRDVNSSDSSRLDNFRSMLLSEEDRTLASHVRRAEITVKARADEDILVELVNTCQHLYELTLRVDGVHEFRRSTLERLGNAYVTERPTPLRALALLSCGIQSPILYQLMSIWPTIQFLRLGTELAAYAPPAPTRAQLYELALHRMPSVAGLEWLLAASAGSLRALELHTAPDAQYDGVLGAHTAHLRSLRLFRHTQRSGALLRRCMRLREVMLTQVSNFLPLGELPAGVEHLTFRHFPGDAGGVPPSVLAAIDKLPRLRLVSCDASAWQSGHFRVLEEKCRQRNVRLDHDVVPFRTVSACLVPVEA